MINEYVVEHPHGYNVLSGNRYGFRPAKSRADTINIITHRISQCPKYTISCRFGCCYINCSAMEYLGGHFQLPSASSKVGFWRLLRANHRKPSKSLFPLDTALFLFYINDLPPSIYWSLIPAPLTITIWINFTTCTNVNHPHFLHSIKSVAYWHLPKNRCFMEPLYFLHKSMFFISCICSTLFINCLPWVALGHDIGRILVLKMIIFAKLLEKFSYYCD